MKTLIAALFAALFAVGSLGATPAAAQDAQTEEARVLATVTAFMAAFDAKDADAMMPLLANGAHLAMVEEREGEDRSNVLGLAGLVTSLSAAPMIIAEPLDVKAVMVGGPVAMVWADYGFYMDGAQSHCGVDIFTLMRIDDEWKIATITYSHIEDACDDAPLP
ncbi:MAG: nuclear transport factor 2 family protein [Alteraurantiacibacter sp.]